ncbi:hypothetical protein GUJ93_ZPchr0003g17363 [Zizania palustris]|uniref:Uncharacterized protein n=1 Tax=Zizania palustris TaxID=103762 RepID=A0A8J5S236_ZIZPA|nr:hypothetical protein GUJ93_ZPchr0003g17363 [Zizania palustris]
MGGLAKAMRHANPNGVAGDSVPDSSPSRRRDAKGLESRFRADDCGGIHSRSTSDGLSFGPGSSTGFGSVEWAGPLLVPLHDAVRPNGFGLQWPGNGDLRSTPWKAEVPVPLSIPIPGGGPLEVSSAGSTLPHLPVRFGHLRLHSPSSWEAEWARIGVGGEQFEDEMVKVGWSQSREKGNRVLDSDNEKNLGSNPDVPAKKRFLGKNDDSKGNLKVDGLGSSSHVVLSSEGLVEVDTKGFTEKNVDEVLADRL